MSDNVTTNINSTIQKTYEWIRDIGEILGTDDRSIAYQALRSVLHALRDRLPTDEVADLAAELPMLIRGIYYEGWRPAATPVKMSPDQFLDHIAVEAELNDWEKDPREFVRAVISVLQRHISEGEFSDLSGALPDDFATLWAEA